MITNRILEILLNLLSFVTIPFQIVSTFVFGILINMTFGLLLIPISSVWLTLFLGPLLALSFLYEKVPYSRIFVSIIGLPITILGYVFCALMPSMGEKESRASKLLLCQCFPYTWHCFQFQQKNLKISLSKGYPYLLKVFDRVPYNDKIIWKHIIQMKAEYEIKTVINKHALK
jgi:hypothetical protein